MSREYEANHSFTRAPVATQLAAYLLILLESLVFSLCIQNNLLNNLSRIIIALLYYLTLTGVLLAGLATSLTDPTDPNIKDPSLSIENNNTTLYCGLCRSIVLEDTRHCKICNR